MSASRAHAAPSSALGYLYQCRYALYATLRRARLGADIRIRLETRDDIHFEHDGKPDELLQTKHHIGKSMGLGDSSADLWKTLRIWSLEEEQDPPDAYFLITTSTAASGSIAEMLADSDARDEATALSRLQTVTITSTSQENAKAYEAFKSLGPQRQARLLARIHVLPEQQEATHLRDALKEELVYAARPEHLDAFLDRLEGWWFSRCIHQLGETPDAYISGSELHSYLEDLREQFRADNLPIDADVFDLLPSPDDFSERTFVKQLELINVGNPRISFAIRDYVRAFTQKSRWLREDLIVVDELERYETRLVEEWERHFEEMRERLGDAAVEEAKVSAAKELYRWVEHEARLPIRPRCDEAFVSRGTYQELSDRREVGWHVDFAARFMALIEGGPPS